MAAQADHESPAPARPATPLELHTALSRHGLPSDRTAFDQALAAALAAVAEVIATYCHRLVLRTDEHAMASLAVPIGGQQRTPAADAFALAVAAGGDR
ncbi:hypothetical protein WN990_33460 [Kitasatospora purpeofusca]|uniref:hypothetical protein n=1 Tax=Kitasatospora purpeofusca TaxID=67352 RepID=UPI0030F309D5